MASFGAINRLTDPFEVPDLCLRTKRKVVPDDFQHRNEDCYFFDDEPATAKMQRPTQLVDIGDVRAALKGLSLSPCKRRRLQSLTQCEEVGSFDKYEPVHALLGEDVKRKTRNSVETQIPPQNLPAYCTSGVGDHCAGNPVTEKDPEIVANTRETSRNGRHHTNSLQGENDTSMNQDVDTVDMSSQGSTKAASFVERLQQCDRITVDQKFNTFRLCGNFAAYPTNYTSPPSNALVPYCSTQTVMYEFIRRAAERLAQDQNHKYDVRSFIQGNTVCSSSMMQYTNEDGRESCRVEVLDELDANDESDAMQL